VAQTLANQIDELMDRASASLVSMRYFEAERHSLKALSLAHRALDFERMTRITLPLQEARRQKAQLAADIGAVTVFDDPYGRLSAPGLYLVQPPCIAIEARNMVYDADHRQIPVHVLTREPLTSIGNWPIVAVNGEVSVRVQHPPPWPLERVQESPTRDRAPGSPDVAWFLNASEALGDAAIAQVNPEDHPHFRVEDLLEFLDCHPLHEKLHQALADACRASVGAPPPKTTRRASRLAYGKWKRVGGEED
jgi:hypothetical protein